MLVHELAEMAQVPAHVVRYYARIGLISPRGRAENGYQLFNSDDALRLLFVRRAQQLGLTLTEIRSFLAREDHGAPPCCARLQETLRKRLAETRRKIAELQSLETRLVSVLDYWASRRGCDSATAPICPLVQRGASRDGS